MDYTNEMSKYNFIKGYSAWNDKEGRYETWDEAVDRVMDMHKEKYKSKISLSERLSDLIDFATHAYKDKFCLASQRSLQFGGEPMLRKNGRQFNCLTSYADRPSFFQDTMWWLLQGGGVGFSVQKHHVKKLPKIKQRSGEAKIFVVPDTIEGWSDAIGVLMSSYFEGGGTFKEYSGCNVLFDFSEIRPEGSLISGGFKAPGPDGLRASLNKIESVIESAIKDGDVLRPIHVYDIVMHTSDAVLSGGIRRSASISICSPDDEEMIEAKTGDWFVKNPQRARSNNSVMLVRSETARETYGKLFKSIKQFGEPGIIWSESTEFMFNPLAN